MDRCNTTLLGRPALLGRRAIVIGAGIAGLAAAAALADHFEQVTVMERDRLPSDMSTRSGTPQAWHLHGVLAGGLHALRELFPGLELDLLRAGAVPLRINRDLREEFPGRDPLPQRDFGWLAYTMSRPLLELVLRRRLKRRANVALWERCRALSLIAARNDQRVAAVLCTTDSGVCQTLPADLVVDASGRGSLTIGLLQSIGRPPPDEAVIGIGLGYATTVLDIPDDAPSDWKGVMANAKAPDSGRHAFMLPIENGRWMLSVVGRSGDHPPGDLDGFMTYVRHLGTPTIHDAIKGAAPVRRIVRFGFPESVWRHFEDLDAFPDGLLPIGDAICRFNPIYGQGMSVAAKEARILHHMLQIRAREADPLNGLGRAFLAEARDVIETPWSMAAVPDFAFPNTTGPRPADLQHRLDFLAALRRLTIRDETAHRLAVEVWHLLRPHSALQDPELVHQVRAEMAEA